MIVSNVKLTISRQSLSGQYPLAEGRKQLKGREETNSGGVEEEGRGTISICVTSLHCDSNVPRAVSPPSATAAQHRSSTHTINNHQYVRVCSCVCTAVFFQVNWVFTLPR